MEAKEKDRGPCYEEIIDKDGTFIIVLFNSVFEMAAYLQRFFIK
jgi:hypothetical protein